MPTQIAEMYRPMPWPVFPEFPVETRYTIEKRVSGDARTIKPFLRRGYIAKGAGTDGAPTVRSKAATRGWKLTIEGARYLGLRMTYEDVIRVADLKTRAIGLRRCATTPRPRQMSRWLITEYLKPGPGKKFARCCAAALATFSQLAAPAGPRNIDSISASTSNPIPISGFLMMRALARMRFLRLKSLALCGRIRADVAMVRRGPHPQHVSIIDSESRWPNAPIS